MNKIYIKTRIILLLELIKIKIRKFKRKIKKLKKRLKRDYYSRKIQKIVNLYELKLPKMHLKFYENGGEYIHSALEKPIKEMKQSGCHE